MEVRQLSYVCLLVLKPLIQDKSFYNGEPLELDELEKRNLLGFVFQDFQLFPHLSVLDNLILSPVKPWE